MKFNEDASSVSAIIPTGDSFKNKGGSIRHTIEALNVQTVPIKELVIVSNGKDKEHQQIKEYIESTALHFRTKLVRALHKNRPESRNIGIHNADANNFLLFMDDDTILGNEQTLKKALKKIDKTNADFFLGAKRLWTTPIGWFENNSELLLSDIKKKDFSRFVEHSTNEISDVSRNEEELNALKTTFIANFGIIRKRIFDIIQMFDEELDLCDDDFLTFQLARAFNGVSSREVSVYHVNHKPIGNSNYSDYFFKLYEEKLRTNNSEDFCTLKYINSISLD